MIIKNLAMGVVVTPPSPATSGTTATLRAGEGAYFGTTFPFLATTAPPDQLSNPNYAEIILVTSKSTDTLTFVRAKRGTTAKSIAANWIIANGIYVEDVNGVAVTVATAAATATKVGTTTDADYVPALGDRLLVTFSNGMNVASPTLNIDGSGAKAINVGNTAVTANLFSTTSAVTVPMFYDGTAYQIYGSYTGIGSNGFVIDQTPTGTVDGSNKVFTTTSAYVGGSLKVFINGIKQKTTTHFVETTPASGIFTMDDAPINGDLITVEYQTVSSVSGNADTVDGVHANATATANQLLPLNASGRFPMSIVEGLIAARQGGTTGDNSWLTSGSSNTTTTGKAIYAQVGVAASSDNTTTSSNGWFATSVQSVTFPVAFTQAPLVFLTTISDHAVPTLVGTTTTGFTWKARANTSVAATVQAEWIAIGQ